MFVGWDSGGNTNVKTTTECGLKEGGQRTRADSRIGGRKSRKHRQEQEDGGSLQPIGYRAGNFGLNIEATSSLQWKIAIKQDLFFCKTERFNMDQICGHVLSGLPNRQ